MAASPDATEWSVVATTAANAVVTATKAAVTGKTHYVTGYRLSASGAPAATVSATLKDGATVVEQVEIPAAVIAPIVVTFRHPLKCTKGALTEVSCPAIGGVTRCTVTLHGFTRTV